jgi:predicted TIM-barrel fold metal-dependent hydrolase
MMNFILRITFAAASLLAITTHCHAQTEAEEFLGAWAFVLPDGNPAWLQVSKDESRLRGKLLWSVGSAKPVNSVEIQDGELTFERKLSWKPYGNSTARKIVGPFRGAMKAARLHLRFDQIGMNEKDKLEHVALSGVRIPSPPPKPDLSKVEYGKPIDLFNGKDVGGWRVSNPKKKNGWSVQEGCLTNVTPKRDFGAYGAYGNLITDRVFTDFELTIDYNVPPGGNSGIYLRGMYEAQVVDRDSRMQGIQGPGAIFGRIRPSRNVGMPGGQWNTYVLTLVDRHITVVLNGVKVIDNELLEGCTGGGIQANDTQPGPIFLQGDHTAVRYRNISLRPVLKRPWIIDPHTHFKGREQIALEGQVTKRNPKDTLGHVVLPSDYRAVADRLGIQSTLVVEAVGQEHPQFNDWMLDRAKSDLVCGYIARGNLSSDDFFKRYQRFRKSGYLKGYRFRFDELHGYLRNKTALQHLKMLERDGMVADLLIEHSHANDAVRLAREFPKLKVVINHCFRARMLNGKVSKEWEQAVKSCAECPNIYCKISSILNFSDAKPFAHPAPANLDAYLPVLQPCFDAFGEDRVIFATNWGVCTHFGNVDDVVRIVSEFLRSKGETALKKGMRENAIRVYGILPRHLRDS